MYYVPCDPTPDPPLYVLDPKTGRNAQLGRLDGLAERPLGLSVSPDGNTILYPRQVILRADLCLSRTSGEWLRAATRLEQLVPSRQYHRRVLFCEIDRHVGAGNEPRISRTRFFL